MTLLEDLDTQVHEPPHGIQNIIKIFGYIPKELALRIEWELDNIINFMLPEPLPASWDPKLQIRMLKIHKKLLDKYEATFTKLYKYTWKYVKDTGGSYNYRTKKYNKTKLSTHCWGIAIDLNVKDNPPNQPPKMHSKIIQIFEEEGWTWGGKWTPPDGMHFQFATGY